MNDNETTWYKLKASGQEFRIRAEESDKVTWRLRFSVVDNVDTPENLERASNWKATLAKEPDEKSAAELAAEFWRNYVGGC